MQSVYQLFPYLRPRAAGSVLVQYCDGVLKQLPDIKTVITVRQQLLPGRTGAAPPSAAAITKETAKKDNTALKPEEKLHNAGTHAQCFIMTL